MKTARRASAPTAHRQTWNSQITTSGKPLNPLSFFSASSAVSALIVGVNHWKYKGEADEEPSSKLFESGRRRKLLARREDQARSEAGAFAEQPRRRQSQQHTRREPMPAWMTRTRRGRPAILDDAEDIRIERRLIEHLVSKPITGGDPLRPLVVAARVAHQDREKRGRAQLPDVHEPHGERDEEDRKRVQRVMLAQHAPDL